MQKPARRRVNFSVAAWGGHNHDSDWIRCHYYKGSDHVQLSSNFQVTDTEWYYAPSVANNPPFGYNTANLGVVGGVPRAN